MASAIEWAMEMHPDERPSTIERFQQALAGLIPRANGYNNSSSQASLSQAVRDNGLIILVSAVLFILAIVLTIV